MEKTKQERCKFCQRFMGKRHNEFHCVVGSVGEMIASIVELRWKTLKHAKL